jgi:N-glycosylase/DNA lyase
MIVGRISASLFLITSGNNRSGKMSLSLGRTRRRTSPYFPSPVVSSSSARTASISASSADAAENETEAKSTGKRKPKEKKSSSSAKKKKQAKMKNVERTKSFEPAYWGNVIIDREDDTEYPPVHTLILGTHPSIASLSKNEMYGHPLNAFWYLTGDAIGFRRSAAVSPTTGKPYVYYHDHLRYSNEHILEYSQQLERLVAKGFAMWDIVAECEREGSLDQDIQEEVANPIREFCEGTLNNVKRIVIANGTTGAKFFVKHFTEWFVDGRLCAASDDMSQRAFKTVMNKTRKRKADGEITSNEDNNVIEVVCVPGVSPAAAKFTYLEKRAAWEDGCFGPGLKDFEEWQSNRQLKKQQPTYQTPEIKTPKRESSTARKTPVSSPKEPAFRVLSSDIAKLAQGNEWIDLDVPPKELRPSATLTNGQCFNWMVVETEEQSPDVISSPRKSAWGTHDAKEWIGPLGDRVLSIKETPTTTLFRVLHGPTEGTKEYLQQYFRLETPLAPLYDEWSKSDPRIAKIAASIPGVRILRQSPLECMFSFICSSNNNIPRITKMLSSFRETYGSFMMEIPIQSSAGNDDESLSIFSFPTLASLANASEDDLRAMGLGYRAKYIVGTRDLLQTNGGEEFLLNLRSNHDFQAVQDELTKFSGIGRKVADCIALFSLDQDDSIPVDIHVQHIASRDYDPTVLGQAKSLTPTIYKRVGDLFRSRFPNRAGWAHSLLFVAELPSFRSVLPLDMVKEMDEWKKHEQEEKAKQKKEKKKER